MGQAHFPAESQSRQILFCQRRHWNVTLYRHSLILSNQSALQHPHEHAIPLPADHLDQGRVEVDADEISRLQAPGNIHRIKIEILVVGRHPAIVDAYDGVVTQVDAPVD